MKRDMDAVRTILLSLADNDALPSAEDIEEEQLAYHIWILKDAGLVSHHSRYLSREVLIKQFFSSIIHDSSFFKKDHDHEHFLSAI